MSYNTFIALLGFAVATSITPGPNNFMLLASGVNFGFWRTVPHMCGIGFGFFTLLLGVGFGLGSLLIAYPQLDLALKVLGAAYMLYLAWKIGMSRTIGSGKAGETSEKPMTFINAALFQWVNPKAWAMAVTAMGLYVDPMRPYWSVLMIGCVFGLTNFPCVSTWAGFGVALREFLSDPVRLKWFNIVMALLLVVSLWPMLK